MRDGNTEWFYKKYMKSNYNIDSRLFYEKSIEGDTILVVDFGDSVFRIHEKTLAEGSLKDRVMCLVEHLKEAKPEHFL